MNWIYDDIPAPDDLNADAATARQGILTKPPGSLGRLEKLAIRLAALQRCQRPAISNPAITVFAADHGVATEGVSAFPQAVTAEMVRNFSAGGAAICVLAREIGASLEVVNLGTVSELESLTGVLDQRIAAGTESFVAAPAMTEEQFDTALAAGHQAVARAIQNGADLFIAGDMGIGNTTSATVLACAMLEKPPEMLVGPGTGLDAKGVSHKLAVIQSALDFHRIDTAATLSILRSLGGFEIVAMTGAYLHAAQQGLPVMVDGYISSVAALAATRINPMVSEWMFLAHRSAEPGHGAVVEALGLEPLLDLGMRLGEGSGAAAAVPLLRLACAMHNDMATFADAGVSEKLDD